MSHNRKICVVGLGYVGLPVALCFAKFDSVIGFDTNTKRLDALRHGIDANGEHTEQELFQDNLIYTSNPDDIASADFYIITVPTPINTAKQPDLTALESASILAGEYLNKEDIIVYESTVYPGTTEEHCIPLLENTSKLQAGEDFFVGYSPERINPGDKQHTFSNIKKIVSGQTDATCEIIAQVYQTVVNAGIHKVPSIKVAEAAKIIENIQRDVNIALINEFSLIFEKMGIDSNDVIEAAATKWNFLPFTPGLVGGHCIGVDPYYLTYKASLLGYASKVISASRQINEGMSKNIVRRTIKYLKTDLPDRKKPLITILGLTFKEDTTDLRNSKVLDIIQELSTEEVRIQIHDPLADPQKIQELCNLSITNFSAIQPASAIILAVAHKAYKALNWAEISKFIDERGVVFDIKAILPRENVPQNITLLRL
ncbi:UDP-glucose dehydrogenase [uncultured Candidatus Thioglobus sp.]|nr:UDP-glucose dehydrogenase [uncultured Candidatus Thioglobus sp.]